MNLKEAHITIEGLRKTQKGGFMLPGLNVVADAAFILDDRVAELEKEAEEFKYILRRTRYTHKNRLIKQIQDKTIEAAIEAVQNRPMKDCMFVRGDAITAIKSVGHATAKTKDVVSERSSKQ